ncbi:MAG: GC-type dockerin domain-anchored protein [Phycisphaerales bacterium]|nr:GC-type dockerin domain-anchored protein [Phycisphaerales bacterium]
MLSTRSLSALRTVIAACAFLMPAAAAFAQPITWTGAGDGVSWNQSANWSPVGLPGSTSNVIVPAGAPINLNTGATISSLNTDRAITHTAGCAVLTITGGLNLGASGSITTTSSGCNNLTFSGTQSVTGTGIIRLNSGYMTVAGASATLTIASGVTVEAANNNASIVINTGNTLFNQGTIRANAASRTVNIGGSATGNLTNDTTGVIEASNSGTINIATVTWTNNGTFLVSSGTLSLGGTFNALGTISRTAGTIGISGSYTGASINANAATGSFNLGSNAAFNGTTFNAADGQGFTLTSGFSMNACTLNAPLALSGGCSILTITGGLNLGASGSITTTSSGCNNLTFSGTQSITGSGLIRLNTGYMTIAGTAATLTVASGVTVEAANNNASIVINTGNTLLNQGTIRANAASRTVNIGGSATGNLTNDTTGVIEASNTGTVSIATVTWTNNGTFLVSNGTLNLGGTGAALGTISRTGGTVNLTGNYTGPILTISNATGPIVFGSGTSFNGTTLNAIDGQTYTSTSAFTMNACTLNAPLTLNGGCSILTITGGLNLGASGSITTTSSGCNNLTFSGTQTISGSGQIILASGYATVAGTNAVLTIGSGVTFRNTGLHNGNFYINAGNTLLNLGTITATGAARSLTINGTPTSTFSNQPGGTLSAFSAGQLVIDNNLGNSGRIVAGTNGTVVLAASRILTNTADGEIELQGTGPNSTTDFGRIRILGTLNAGGTLAVTYPNGLVPGCRIAVPIITTQGAGVINGQFAVRTGPPKPSPFAIYFSVTPTGAIFSSTNLADVGSAGAVPQPDGVLDNNDFIVFIDLFFSLNPIADRGSTGGVPGSDGTWDNNDFIVYIDQFFAGCG